MPATKNRRAKNIKVFFLLLILFSFGAVLWVFVGSRQPLTRPGHLLSSVAEMAKIYAERVHQTAIREGKTEWSLSAGSARLLDSEKQAEFQDLSITFFMDDENRVYLTASRGTVATDSKNIEVDGNVVLRNGPYQLKTEKLSYLHDQRVIFSEVPVKISGQAFNFVADAMRFDLKANKTSFEGNIKGLFNEKMPL